MVDEGRIRFDLGKMVKNVNYLLKAIEVCISKGNVDMVKDILRILSLYSEQHGKSKLLLAVGYAFSINPEITLKSLIELLEDNSVSHELLVDTLSAVIGFRRLFSKLPALDVNYDNLIVKVLPKLSCNELSVLLNMIKEGKLSLSKSCLCSIIKESLIRIYCKEAKTKLVEAIPYLIRSSTLSLEDLTHILRSVNAKMVIVKNRVGEVKVVRLILKSEESLCLSKDVASALGDVISP